MATTSSADANADAPPQPKAILRGHKAQVHAAAFARSNERLLTGDADGFVVAWDLTIMRPRAVWQAHENAILGISGWGPDKIITHGRDNKLIVWKLSAEDEAVLSTTLPLSPTAQPRTKPWMLHLLEVNTMNFCSFASTSASASGIASNPSVTASTADSGLLIAVPNTLASEAVDIYSLPSQTRIHTVKLGSEYGMAMALALSWINKVLTLVAGYENGMAIVAQLEHDGSWTVTYRKQCHKQPVLSLDIGPTLEYFFTSSADATIAKHPIPTQSSEVAGPIGNPTETLALKPESKESPLPDAEKAERQPHPGKPVSLLSAAFASQSSEEPPKFAKKRDVVMEAIKVIDTKHAGQQGLRVRSDGRIFATAGWDSRIRVYSTKTMHEVAVLKWHSVGCFAVAFADVNVTSPGLGSAEGPRPDPDDEDDPSEKRLVHRVLDLTVKDRRINQARKAHWLAAGSKDGKVSLWDVFRAWAS